MGRARPDPGTSRRGTSCMTVNPRLCEDGMKHRTNRKSEEGKIGWILLWAIGIPIPILLIVFLLRGCT